MMNAIMNVIYLIIYYDFHSDILYQVMIFVSFTPIHTLLILMTAPIRLHCTYIHATINTRLHKCVDKNTANGSVAHRLVKEVLNFIICKILKFAKKFKFQIFSKLLTNFRLMVLMKLYVKYKHNQINSFR